MKTLLALLLPLVLAPSLMAAAPKEGKYTGTVKCEITLDDDGITATRVVKVAARLLSDGRLHLYAPQGSEVFDSFRAGTDNFAQVQVDLATGLVTTEEDNTTATSHPTSIKITTISARTRHNPVENTDMPETRVYVFTLV